MDKRNQDREKMVEGTRKVIDLYIDKTAEYPAFPPLIASLDTDMADLQTAAVTSKDATTGKTELKGDLGSELVDGLVRIASALWLISFKPVDEQLRASAAVNETELHTLRETELVTKGKSLMNLARGKLAELPAFGISEDEVTAVGECLDAFKNSIGGSESGKAVRKGANKSIGSISKTMMLDLLKIDKMMDIVKKKYPDFGEAYAAARRIRSTGGRHRPPDPPAPPAPQK